MPLQRVTRHVSSIDADGRRTSEAYSSPDQDILCDHGLRLTSPQCFAEQNGVKTNLDSAINE